MKLPKNFRGRNRPSNELARAFMSEWLCNTLKLLECLQKLPNDLTTAELRKLRYKQLLDAITKILEDEPYWASLPDHLGISTNDLENILGNAKAMNDLGKRFGKDLGALEETEIAAIKLRETGFRKDDFRSGAKRLVKLASHFI